MTNGEIFNERKDYIKHALDGEIMYAENEDGAIYRPASKEEITVPKKKKSFPQPTPNGQTSAEILCLIRLMLTEKI